MRALRVLKEQSEAVSARVRDEVMGLLAADASPEGQVRAVRRAYALLDGEGGRVRSRVAAPACGAGCSSCCHVHVEATEPEILAVAAHIEDTLGPEGLRALEQRLAAHVARAERLTDDERWQARIPCALLDGDGRCSVYEARPLRCRAFHSSSADACRDALEGRGESGPPTIPALVRALDAVEGGYERALAAAALSADPRRLEGRLLAALHARAAASTRT